MEMPEILFRGKRADNGEWVEGFYAVIAGENHYIFTGRIDLTQGSIGCEYFKVYPETVGRYTGLTDKNGVKIFEGDIVTYNKEYGGETREKGTVYWCDGAFWVEGIKDEECYGLLGALVKYQLEVIGNVHDGVKRDDKSSKTN